MIGLSPQVSSSDPNAFLKAGTDHSPVWQCPPCFSVVRCELTRFSDATSAKQCFKDLMTDGDNQKASTVCSVLHGSFALNQSSPTWCPSGVLGFPLFQCSPLPNCSQTDWRLFELNPQIPSKCEDNCASVIIRQSKPKRIDSIAPPVSYVYYKWMFNLG